MVKLPPLFDDITDTELASKSMEMQELVSQINRLREKQLSGGGLSDDEVREGISLIVKVRRIRAGGKGGQELPAAITKKLEEYF